MCGLGTCHRKVSRSISPSRVCSVLGFRYYLATSIGEDHGEQKKLDLSLKKRQIQAFNSFLSDGTIAIFASSWWNNYASLHMKSKGSCENSKDFLFVKTVTFSRKLDKNI